MSDKDIATMMGVSDYEMIFISKEAVNNQPEKKVDYPIEYKARFYCWHDTNRTTKADIHGKHEKRSRALARQGNGR